MPTDSDFARNLALLCSYHPSIAEVCRRLSINRQQFNKYLGGSTLPSRHNLRRICDFFGVEEAEMYLPHRRFADLVALRPRGTGGGSRSSPVADVIEGLVDASGTALDAYQGYYYRYFYSYGFRGKIVKSLMSLFHDGRYYCTKNLGILKTESSGRKSIVHFKYRGLALLINGRIFLTEYESRLNDMVSETILYPSYRHRVDLLAGIQCTLAGTRGRDPSAGKVVFEYLGRRIDVRRALRSCGLFAADSGAIAPEIEARIRNRIPDGAFVLSADEEAP